MNILNLHDIYDEYGTVYQDMKVIHIEYGGFPTHYWKIISHRPIIFFDSERHKEEIIKNIFHVYEDKYKNNFIRSYFRYRGKIYSIIDDRETIEQPWNYKDKDRNNYTLEELKQSFIYYISNDTVFEYDEGIYGPMSYIDRNDEYTLWINH